MHHRRSKGRRPRGDGTRGPRSSCAASSRPPATSRALGVEGCASYPSTVCVATNLLLGVVTAIVQIVLALLTAVTAPMLFLPGVAAGCICSLRRHCRRAPVRSLFTIFLLSGINLEANIAITKEQEERAVGRAMAIAELDADAYASLLAQNEAALKELRVITSCQLVQASKLNDSYCKVTLNCITRCGGRWRQPMLRLSRKIPTLAQAAEIMLEHVLEHHAACIAEDEQSSRGSCECEGSCTSSATSSDAFSRMRDAQRRLAEQRAAELRVRWAEQNLENERKRMRLIRGTADTSSKDPTPTSTCKPIPYYERYKQWDLSQFQTRMGEAMRRRNKLLSSTATSHPEPRNDGTDEHDALLHWRRGLVGAVQVECSDQCAFMRPQTELSCACSYLLHLLSRHRIGQMALWRMQPSSLLV